MGTSTGNGNGSSTGSIQRQRYKCFLLFLPNETGLLTRPEEWFKKNFWEVSDAVGRHVFFVGITHGDGLVKARRKFGITKRTEPVILILESAPLKWKQGDPLAVISLRALKTEDDALELLLHLIELLDQGQAIRTVKRGKVLAWLRQTSTHIPEILEYVKFLPLGG